MHIEEHVMDKRRVTFRVHGAIVLLLPDSVREALRIIKLAEKRKIMLRVMGSCAVRLHCPKYEYLHTRLGRRELLDIDLMSYSKFESKMEKFFRDFGYTPRQYIFKFWERATTMRRHIYDDEKNNRVVDVFFDRLEMCHTTNFVSRLELDYPTITLADIVLQKMQIVKLTERDIKDTILLFREHEVGETDKETINAKYIANLLSKNWGFCYSVTRNLNWTKEFLRRCKVLTVEDCNNVTTKIDELLQALRREPKSLKWKIRSKIGTRKKWYTEVEEAILPGASRN